MELENKKPEVVKNTDLDFSQCLIYDGHLLKTYRACQEKFNLFEVQHIVSREHKAAPAFGIAMHEAIAVWRMAMTTGEKFQDALLKAQQALLAAYKTHMPIEMQSEIMADALRGPKNGLRLLTGYCQHYAPMGYKWSHVEVPFALYLGKVRVPIMVGPDLTYIPKDLIYVGIIDGVHELQGQVKIDDIKTTAWYINENYLNGFRLDQSLMGYLIAARELLGINTNYGVVHCIWIQKEPKSVGAKPLDSYYHTKEIYWDDSQLNEWTDNTLRTVEDIELKKIQGNNWIRDFGQNCGAFGGCDFRPICWTTPAFRSKIIELDFKRAIWTPLEDERLQEIIV